MKTVSTAGLPMKPVSQPGPRADKCQGTDGRRTVLNGLDNVVSLTDSLKFEKAVYLDEIVATRRFDPHRKHHRLVRKKKVLP